MFSLNQGLFSTPFSASGGQGTWPKLARGYSTLQPVMPRIETGRSHLGAAHGSWGPGWAVGAEQLCWASLVSQILFLSLSSCYLPFHFHYYYYYYYNVLLNFNYLPVLISTHVLILRCRVGLNPIRRTGPAVLPQAGSTGGTRASSSWSLPKARTVVGALGRLDIGTLGQCWRICSMGRGQL